MSIDCMTRVKREWQREVRNEADLSMSLRWVEAMVRKGLEGGMVRISLGRARRTEDQNQKLWPMLTDVSKQVDWYGQKLSPEEWKDVFSAVIRKQKVVPGLDGGFVVMGMRTSKMDKQTFSDLIEVMYAFGAERGVIWSEPAKKLYEKTKRAA